MAKYNQDGGGGVGTATANPEPSESAPSTEQPTGAAQANPEKAQAVAEKAQTRGDKEIHEEARAKLKADPSYRITPEEAEAVRNVQKGKPRPGTPKVEAAATPEAESQVKPVPEVPAPFKAAMERLKVEKAEDLPGSVEKLQAELQRLNGERGNLGPLQEKVTTHARTIEHQHAIMRDLLAGKPEAIEWARKNAQALGLDPTTIKLGQAQAQAEAGEFNPDDALDVQTAKYVKGIETKLQSALDKLEQLGQNTEKYGKFYETELEKQARTNSFESAASLIQTLIDTEGVSGLYDKRHGPLRPHLDAFFERGEVNDKNKGIVEILRIANERKLEDLSDAYAIWERKNRGSRAVAAARAAQADPNVVPTVGLSDRQEGNGGRVNIGPTVEDVIAWRDGKKPIPSEFTKHGKFQRSLISPEVWAQVEARRGR